MTPDGRGVLGGIVFHELGHIVPRPRCESLGPSRAIGFDAGLTAAGRWCAGNRAQRVKAERIAAAAVLLGLVTSAGRAAELGPGDAARHVGETATVCGVVASAKYLARSATKPTLLDLGEPYPDEIFTVVIFGRDRDKFGTPETTLKGRRVCVTGKIEEFRGMPEIVLADPQKLTQ